MTCSKCKKEAPQDALFCPWCGLKLNPDKPSHKTRQRPNGAGTAYKRGKTWTARVVAGWKIGEAGKALPVWRTKGGFPTKREALAYCSDLLKAPASRHKRPLTMQDVYTMWQPTHINRVSHSTINCYRAAWRYFEPLYQMPFADIGVEDLQDCIDSCGQGKRTKENMKALAGLLMKFALPRHQTDMNYALYLNTGNDLKGTRPAFSAEQVEALHTLIGRVPHAEDIYVLICTGFRPAELFALTRDSYQDGILYGGSKTEAGKGRAVPVFKEVRAIVEDKLTYKSEYIFPRDDGSKMTVNYFRDNYFYPALAAAGIQPIPTPENPAYYVPYSCRHTFANLLKNAIGSDKDKAALIGHEDYTTTKKHYQSSELKALQEIVSQLY